MVTIKRHAANPILAKNPDHEWESGAVFNPCVIRDGDVFRMYYRATNGGYISNIGYAESGDGVSWRRNAEPVLTAGNDFDRSGCEDPRVTKIGDMYYMHYTAIVVNDDDWTVRIGLATSKDGKNWEKRGIVGPAGSRSKAATLFPKPIGGKYWWFYTWEADRPESTIMSVAADSLDQIVAPPAGQVAMTLENYDTWAVFAPPSNAPTYRGAEVGAPPVETEKGWLLIYCSANLSDHAEWTVKAALLDRNDPRRVLAETPEPILKPELDAELHGAVNNVTFPEGAVVVGEELYVYYGSGDQGCCLATCNLKELLDYLESVIPKQ
jgi:beta-1,2-mannobiose phosphorylase / 1,2-beta-oligomannan phosphorylase